jgi:hypothetical protein
MVVLRSIRSGVCELFQKLPVQKCRLAVAALVLGVAAKDFGGGIGVSMDPLLYVALEKVARRNRTDWSRPPPSGAGRLLTASAIIAVAVWLLDDAASKGPHATLMAYDASQQGRWK